MARNKRNSVVLAGKEVQPVGLHQKEFIGIEAGQMIPQDIYLFDSTMSKGADYIRAGAPENHFNIDKQRDPTDIIITHLTFEFNGKFKSEEEYQLYANLLQSFFENSKVVFEERGDKLDSIYLDHIASRVPKMAEDGTVIWREKEGDKYKLPSPIIVPRGSSDTFEIIFRPLKGLFVDDAVTVQSDPTDLTHQNPFIAGLNTSKVGMTFNFGIYGYQIYGNNGEIEEQEQVVSEFLYGKQ